MRRFATLTGIGSQGEDWGVVDYIQVFNDSFTRVTAPAFGPRFFDVFYARFVAADAVVAEKFRHTDLDHQKQMLRESLGELRAFFESPRSNPYIVTLARIHGVRGHDVSPNLYDRWLDCLIATVREVDPEANDSVELAWRIVMAPGIEFMKFYRAR